MRNISIISILASLALLLACEKQPDTVPVSGITLSQTTLSMTEGESATITATVSPDNATNKQVRWSSSNPEILVSNGKITTSFKSGAATSTVGGRQVLGNSTITATTEDGGKKATCQITVFAKTIAVTGISLSENSLSMAKGDTHTLIATVKPDNATDKTIKWTSSNSSVASVDQNGSVTAIGGGNATISATVGDFSASCSIDVTVPIQSISLDKTLFTLAKGSSIALTATVLPADASEKNIHWSSSKPSVATVDQNGMVTAIGEGSATITASVGGLSATCTVISIVIPVTSITLDKTSLSMEKGTSETLKATVLPNDATDKTVQWRSDNTSVATVDQNGQVTAVNSGNTTITASAGEITATCAVSVFIPVTSISLNLTNLTLLLGETALLEATISPDDATEKSVVWLSSNPGVATVDGGRITTVDFGSTVIKAEIGNQSATCTVTVLTDSPSGVLASYDGGEISYDNDLILYGSSLDFSVTNLSSETITVDSVQVFDGDNGTSTDILTLGNSLSPGVAFKWTFNVPAAGIHFPKAVFTYSFRGEHYTCSAKFFVEEVSVISQP